MGAEKHEPEEEWGMIVVLFNTWGDVPPEGLGLGSEVRGDGDVGENGGGVEAGGGEAGRARERWNGTFPLRSDVTPEEEDGGTVSVPAAAKIWLLGNERRRDHPLRIIKLYDMEGGGERGIGGGDGCEEECASKESGRRMREVVLVGGREGCCRVS